MTTKRIAILTIIVLVSLFPLATTAQNGNSEIGQYNENLTNAKTRAEQFAAWRDLIEYYSYRGHVDSSRIAAAQLIKIATESHEDSLLAAAYIHLGWYFLSTGDFKQSLENKFKGLEAAERVKDPDGIWLAAKEVGVDYKLLKNYAESLKYLKKAENLLKDCSSTSGDLYNRTYTHLSEVYLSLGQADSALYYIQLTEQKTSKDTDPYGYARMLYIFANVYRARGDSDLADSYYKKCIAYSGEHNIMTPFVNACTNYGKHLYDRGEYGLSKSYALAGLMKANESKYKLGIIDVSDLLRMAYGKLGLKDSSYYYAEIKDAMRDSVFNEQQTNQIQNLSFAQKIKEKEDEVARAAELLQRQQNIQYALMALGIVSFLILFFLLSRSIIVTEKWISFFGILGLLIVFEFINLLIHPFLERVTHHSPFLMLLALVALASLLIPLHHRLEKWIKVKMTEKNKKIRLENARRTIEQIEGK
jgi:tetratricopeptide (TPR) repeat protein